MYVCMYVDNQHNMFYMQGHEDQADGARGGVAEQVRGTGPGDGDTVPGQIQPAQVRTIANRIQKNHV